MRSPLSTSNRIHLRRLACCLALAVSLAGGAVAKAHGLPEQTLSTAPPTVTQPARGTEFQVTVRRPWLATSALMSAREHDIPAALLTCSQTPAVAIQRLGSRSFEVRVPAMSRSFWTLCGVAGAALPKDVVITTWDVFGPVQAASTPGSHVSPDATGGTALWLAVPPGPKAAAALATLQQRIRDAALGSAKLAAVESWTLASGDAPAHMVEVHLPALGQDPQKLAALLAPLYQAYGCGAAVVLTAAGAYTAPFPPCKNTILQAQDDFGPVRHYTR